MNRSGLFAGTFDPPTLGHLDIIHRASKICDKLYVALAENIKKRDKIFTLQERKAMLTEMTKGIPNVEVVYVDGLVVDCVKTLQVDFLIRGLRTYSELENEMHLAIANRQIGDVETLFLLSDPSFQHICSSLIQEIASYGRRLHNFVPESIENAVYMRIADPCMHMHES